MGVCTGKAEVQTYLGPLRSVRCSYTAREELVYGALCIHPFLVLISLLYSPQRIHIYYTRNLKVTGKC